jgi:hypothetical protein
MSCTFLMNRVVLRVIPPLFSLLHGPLPRSTKPCPLEHAHPAPAAQLLSSTEYVLDPPLFLRVGCDDPAEADHLVGRGAPLPCCVAAPHLDRRNDKPCTVFRADKRRARCASSGALGIVWLVVSRTRRHSSLDTSFGSEGNPRERNAHSSPAFVSDGQWLRLSS